MSNKTTVLVILGMVTVTLLFNVVAIAYFLMFK
jgi:hypothetical protein